ncbi:unnamed protein product [Brassicogethes aeneus]|uniref:Uncharacterized protein n=1 Tax=Brassicogethes aeneus TaxID=1431903 RepID=A0A9P0AQY7_BRAAE|nr:unnamed protein product [Brassicogethes aeneus]
MKVILVLSALLVVAFAAPKAKEVKVTVFYASLCPGSIKYLVEQAIPGFKKLQNIKLDLVPFGRTIVYNIYIYIHSQSVNRKFVCHGEDECKGNRYHSQSVNRKFLCHGEDECKGNRYHGCVLDLNPIDKATSYIACDLAADNPSDDKTLQKAKEVKVTVFYKSLCPGSIKYLVEQAIPGFKKLSQNIKLDLVPFGRTVVFRISGTRKFYCVHGRDECKGNRYHGCVLDLNPIDKATSYIACDLAADNPSDDKTLQKCANETDISWTNLKKCVEGEKGDEIMAKYNERAYNVTNPPTTFFNDVYNKDLSEEPRASFVTTVCSFLDNEPAACKK